MKNITESKNPDSMDIDQKSLDEIIKIFNDEERKVVEAVASQAPQIAKVIELIVHSFKHEGRLFYIGAGSSGRLGVLDAAECPPTFSTPPELVQAIIAGGNEAIIKSIEGAEDQAEEGIRAIRQHSVNERDVIVGITASGGAPYVLAALKEAYFFGAKTVLLACSPPKEGIEKYIDVFITPIVGPEIIAGSTRLKAGTATKLILNMLSTISMIKIGKTYGNLMVDVQATNSKLLNRAIRIIAEVTEVDYKTAVEFLQKAKGNAKMAIVMIKKNVSYERAIELLDEHDGFLGKIL